MTGYVRVDTSNNIADGNVISAADLDNEFDGIQAAFNASTGHNHDGTTGEGAPILVLGPTQDVVVGASTVTPKTTNTVDIGSSSLKFKDLFLAGNASIGGTLAVTGVATLTAQPILSSLTASRAVFTDGSKGLVSNAITGTGNVVMSASPTLTGTITAEALTTSSTVTINGGTANGVAYLNGSKVLTTGSALVFDGTTLAVARGSEGLYLKVGGDNASNGRALTFTSSTTGGSNGALHTINASSATGVIAFATNSTEAMRIASSGNVGVGTTAPSAKFVVSDAGGIGLEVAPNFTGGIVRQIAYDRGTAAFVPMRTQASQHEFYTNAGEKLRLSATGGVSIGTTTDPGAGGLITTGNTTLGDASTDTVQVNGYMSVGGAGGSATGLWVRNNALTGANQTGLLVSPVGTTSGTSVAAIVTSPGTAASAYTATSLYGMYVGDAVKGAGSTITTQNGISIGDQTQGVTNVGLSSNVTSGSGKWNIYASGTALNYFAGNVGIGATPSIWFTGYRVVDFGTSAVSANGGNTEISLQSNNYRDAAANFIYKTTAAAGRYSITVGQHTWYSAPSGTAGGTITFTQAMTLQNNGNLGIGTTAPASRLDVADATSAIITLTRTDSTAGNGIIRSIGNTGVTNASINLGGGVNNNMVFTTNAAERMRIDSSGNVLVGTTTNTNSSSLVVNGTISETVSGVQHRVVSQADIGTAPNDVPLNQYLGDMAYMNAEAVVIQPQASVTPNGIGDMVFQLTSNTSLVVKVKGSDGTVRSVTLTLA